MLRVYSINTSEFNRFLLIDLCSLRPVMTIRVTMLDDVESPKLAHMKLKTFLELHVKCVS